MTQWDNRLVVTEKMMMSHGQVEYEDVQDVQDVQDDDVTWPGGRWGCSRGLRLPSISERDLIGARFFVQLTFTPFDPACYQLKSCYQIPWRLVWWFNQRLISWKWHFCLIMGGLMIIIIVMIVMRWPASTTASSFPTGGRWGCSRGSQRWTRSTRAAHSGHDGYVHIRCSTWSTL